MTFVDTSALYALASAKDPNHGRAAAAMRAMADRGEPLLTHTYVLLETFALLHRRHGIAPALRVDRLARTFEVVAVDRALHERAAESLKDRRISLVDAVSFEVMRDRGLEEAFAFDPDFTAAGFRLAGA